MRQALELQCGGGCGAGPTGMVHEVELCGASGRAVLLQVWWPGCRQWHFSVWNRDERGCCRCGVLRGGKRSLDPLAAFAVPGWVETAVTHLGPGSVCQPWGGELQRWRREQRLISLSTFGDRWVPGIPDSPTVNEGQSACPLSWQAWSLRGRGQLLGPHRALMGRGQARSPSPPALGTMPSPHPRHRQAARLPLPCRPLPLVSFLSSALPGASCRPLLSSFAWSSSVPWPLPSTLHASFCSESGSVSSLAWKVYMGPYPAFCLQRALNGFVGLVGVEGGEEE